MTLLGLPQPQGPLLPIVITLSTARSRALSLLHSEYPIHPDVFAHYMWPESTSWSRDHQPGRAIRAKANTFLAQLERDGLARRCGETNAEPEGYVISSRGAEVVRFVREFPADTAPYASGCQRTSPV